MTIENGQYNQDLFIPLLERLKNRGRDYTLLMRCPIDNTSLHVEGEELICEEGHHNYTRDGIVYLIDDVQKEKFDDRAQQKFDAHVEDGWKVPEEDEFKRVPQTGIDGYPQRYWQNRAFATAEMWRFLEELRNESGRLPVGHMGNAVDFTGDMGWMGYGLDVSGYATVIQGHDTTKLGLAAYQYGRYPRVQAPIQDPPLTKGAFDLLVYSYCMRQVENIEFTITNGAKLLNEKDGGHMIILLDRDEGDLVDEIVALMEAQDLSVEHRRVGAMGGTLKKLSTNLRGGPSVPPLLIGTLG